MRNLIWPRSRSIRSDWWLFFAAVFFEKTKKIFEFISFKCDSLTWCPSYFGTCYWWIGMIHQTRLFKEGWFQKSAGRSMFFVILLWFRDFWSPFLDNKLCAVFKKVSAVLPRNPQMISSCAQSSQTEISGMHRWTYFETTTHRLFFVLAHFLMMLFEESNVRTLHRPHHTCDRQFFKSWWSSRQAALPPVPTWNPTGFHKPTRRDPM